MPEGFAITGVGKAWRDDTKQLILWKKQPKYWAANGEIDFYPIADIQSGIARTLTGNEWEQKWNLGDLKKPSSPLGYLPSKHNLIKGSLRIISEDELSQILQAQ
jgi:hypothetical protein